MVATALSISLGSAIITFGVLSMIINFSILMVLIKCKFLHKSQSPIYILAAAGIIGSLLQAFLYTAYLGPSSIVQSFLIAENVESPWVKFLGYLFHVLWIYDLLMQVAIAANRTVIVVRPHMHRLLSRTFTIGMTFLALLLAIIVASVANYGSYCCSFYLNYVTFSYSFVSRGPIFNTANFFIDLPVNTVCSIACIVFYVVIFAHIRGSTKKIHSTMGDRAAQARNSRELKIAFQFFICSGTYISIWITFRVVSYCITTQHQELKVILTMLHIFHCTANSIVFLIFNKDIRRGFFNVFLKVPPVSTTSAVVVKIRNPTTSKVTSKASKASKATSKVSKTTSQM